MSLPWPSFWDYVQDEEDRAALRVVLTELLSQGSILGDGGRSRELYRLVRERYSREVGEYLAPLGLKLVFYEEPYPIMLAEPQPDECRLLARFDKQESIFALVLWRLYDEAFMQARSKAVLFDTNTVWKKWQVYFPKVEPPTGPMMRKLLATLRRKNFVRTADAGDPAHPDELTIEVLPTLARAIDFDGIAEWQAQGGQIRRDRAGEHCPAR